MLLPPRVLQGTLIFLCGGDEALFERTKGTMDGALGKAAHFFGPVGSGSRMKLVVNMTMGTMMNSLVSLDCACVRCCSMMYASRWLAAMDSAVRSLDITGGCLMQYSPVTDAAPDGGDGFG